METSNLSVADFKTLVIRMLKELSEDLSIIKKIQSETLIEIKNNLQVNNSRVNEAENQINDMEYKEEKQTTNQNNKKKKESKKTRIV